MAKIRHIAIRAEDPDATAKMFVEVFGLEFIQKRAHGPVDLSDGDVNITVLPMNGAKELNPIRLGEAYYESKFMSAEGLVIDVGHWKGASPIDKQAVGAAKN
jgi:catechol 2,3-dioxygenase-like lactoylglutathione lyase family enzyme